MAQALVPALVPAASALMPTPGVDTVAQPLVPAASALMPTPVFDTVSQPRKGVETGLDTAGTSACATSAGGV
ncbi:exported hypothetical protein [Candidatus Sulfopaludibacter sp. SbA4]|nr:exported hypothetical protein [Candidatus Sulfopaludibacter sp. SbA4]